MNDRPEVEVEVRYLLTLMFVVENDVDLGLCVFVFKRIQTMTEDSRPPLFVIKRIHLVVMYSIQRGCACIYAVSGRAIPRFFCSLNCGKHDETQMGVDATSAIPLN